MVDPPRNDSSSSSCASGCLPAAAALPPDQRRHRRLSPRCRARASSRSATALRRAKSRARSRDRRVESRAHSCAGRVLPCRVTGPVAGDLRHASVGDRRNQQRRAEQAHSRRNQRFPSVFASSRAEVVLLMEGVNGLPLVGPDISAGVMRIMVQTAKTGGARVFVGSMLPQVAGGRARTRRPASSSPTTPRCKTMARQESAELRGSLQRDDGGGGHADWQRRPASDGSGLPSHCGDLLRRDQERTGSALATEDTEDTEKSFQNANHLLSGKIVFRKNSLCSPVSLL